MPSWPIDEIQRLLEPTLAHMGYSIYSIGQAGPGGKTLRIAIDKTDGYISLEDCERVTLVASPLLDQADLIHSSYTLEVSSPGAERKLRDRAEYTRFVGHKVNVRYQAGSSEVALEGILVAADDAGVAVRGHKGEVTHLPWADVLATRLVASL
jgi:ribosome maturation factor RimP